MTPDAGQNPGATKIPLPLRAGDKKAYAFLVYGPVDIVIMDMLRSQNTNDDFWPDCVAKIYLKPIYITKHKFAVF